MGAQSKKRYPFKLKLLARDTAQQQSACLSSEFESWLLGPDLCHLEVPAPSIMQRVLEHPRGPMKGQEVATGGLMPEWWGVRYLKLLPALPPQPGPQ